MLTNIYFDKQIICDGKNLKVSIWVDMSQNSCMRGHLDLLKVVMFAFKLIWNNWIIDFLQKTLHKIKTVPMNSEIRFCK